MSLVGLREVLRFEREAISVMDRLRSATVEYPLVMTTSSLAWNHPSTAKICFLHMLLYPMLLQHVRSTRSDTQDNNVVFTGV